MARKFGFEAPICSHDHIHEFGYRELIEAVQSVGFRHDRAMGVHFQPYWSLEHVLGHRARKLTDNDEEVNNWLIDIGKRCPEYAFIQCHRFVRT
jgi:hypothetical protein